jgi:vacuolar-type H+-ATPase subunit D/Vma8
VAFLAKKEKEVRAVIDELSYRSTLDDNKDILIKRLTTAISKIEEEGCEVLQHVVKQNEKIKTLKEQVEEEESDKIFLMSKAKEQLKLANQYKKLLRQQIHDNK